MTLPYNRSFPTTLIATIEITGQNMLLASLSYENLSSYCTTQVGTIAIGKVMRILYTSRVSILAGEPRVGRRARLIAATADYER